MTVHISGSYLDAFAVTDTAALDTFEDFTGNLKTMLNFRGTDDNGDEIDPGALIWLVQSGDLQVDQTISPDINSVADGSKPLPDGVRSTHRVDAEYGSLFYNAVSGAFAFVVNAQAVNALLMRPALTNFPDIDLFYVFFRVTVEATDTDVFEGGIAGLYMEIVSATDDVARVESVPQAFDEGYIGVVIGPENLIINDPDTAAENIFVKLDQLTTHGSLYRDGVLLFPGAQFTQQDLNDGLIEFIFNPNSIPETISLVFEVAFTGDNPAQNVTLELFQRQPHTLVDNIVASNIVDLSTEDAGKTISTGDGRDTIKGTQGEDEIEAGLGDDIIDLGDSGAPTGHLRYGLQNLKDASFIEQWPGYSGNGFEQAQEFAWGDIWLNGQLVNNLFQRAPSFNDPTNRADGSYYTNTLLHETGHAVGLWHSFQKAGISGTNYGDTVDYGSIDNTMSYTVMSYYNYLDEIDDTAPLLGLPTTLMRNDIAALQYMYGVNEQTRRGDDVYTLSSFNNTGENFIHATIWDAAGEDTLSWADQTTRAQISLVAGSHSFFGSIDGLHDSTLHLGLEAGAGLLGIAYNCDIENAIGGTASDFIIGNHLDNILFGGASRDGEDTLTGGEGADIFVARLRDAGFGEKGDIVSDFTDGIDFIGLSDVSSDALSWVDASSLEDGTRTRIYDAASNATLFFLDNVNVSQIDASDFVQTDFV